MIKVEAREKQLKRSKKYSLWQTHSKYSHFYRHQTVLNCAFGEDKKTVQNEY